MLKLLTTLLLICCFSFSTSAQSPHDEALLEMTKNCKARSEDDIEKLAQCLVSQATTAEDSVRLLAYWLTQNIKYDIVALEKGTLNRDADAIKKRAGVCEDYAWLFQQMCLAVGIESYFVSGYSKGYGHRPGRAFKRPSHAWNVVKIGEEYAFVEVTWASGYVQKTNKKSRYFKRFNPELILATPEKFFEGHLPANPMWQLRNDPVSMETFAGLPPTEQQSTKIDYKAEIAAFTQLDELGRKAENARRGYAFYPIEYNYRNMMGHYMNAGFGLANNSTDKAGLERGKQYMLTVKQIATENVPFKKLKKGYLQKVEQGLEYVDRKIKKLE